MIPQTPWLERSFHFDFPVTIFPVVFSRLEGTIFRLHAMLQNVTEEQGNNAAGGWNVKQQIGHLYDLEALWWQRLNDYAENKATLSPADITNQKTTEAGHEHQLLETLVNQFTVERQRMLETVYFFDKEQLQKVAIHPRLQQEFRLIDALYFIAEHDDHHLAQIATLLRKTA